MIQLFPDQDVLVAGLRAAMATSRRVLAVAPTGFGKTVVLSYMTSRARERGRRIGIFAHRAELLEQISAALRQFKVPHGVIAAGCNPDRRHSVFVCSAQTYARRLAHMPRFDLGIVDEAHHATGGSTWGKCMEHSPTAKWIGVTATPERLDGRGLSEMFDDMVIGPTVRALIDAGRLSDYRLFAPNDVSREGMRMLGGDFNKGEAADAADKPRVTGNVIRHYRKHLDGAPTAAFCVTVAHAEHVAEEFRAAGYRAASLDGKMDTNTRANIVRDFRNGQLNVITSAELLSEGFDVPGMYGALLIRPTKSLALYLQQVGRALRKAPGKDKATIIDHVGNSNDDTGHGLPCLERSWSLEGRADAKLKQAVSSARECGKCFARVPISRTSCPECGTVFPRHVRELEQVEGELIEQDIELRRKVERKPESPAMKAQRQTRTLEGLADLFRRQKQEKLGRDLTDEEIAAQARRAEYVMQARQAKRA